MAEQKPREYFATLRQTFPLATGTDPESFKKTLDMLASTQRSRTALKALGKEEKPATKPGLFSKLFDQDKGVLMAPARFGSALVLDVLGYEDPNLAETNPLVSAIKSAKGDFAITGGDVFKVQDGDSVMDRLGKFAAAFAFDVATDPISYLGPVATFSKGGAAVSAVRQGDNILSAALRVGGENGGKIDTLVDDLFRRSRLFNAADTQRRFAKAGVELAEDSPIKLLGMTPEGVVSDEVKRKIAGAQMGLLVGESFLKGGRVGLRKELTSLLGSEQAARALFRELPEELAGGLFLKTITGRPVARIAGGRGGSAGVLGAAAETASKLRFGASATGAGRWVSKYFSGQSGPLWAEMKKGLASGKSAAERTNILDYMTYKKGLTELGLTEAAVMHGPLAVQSSVQAVRTALGSEVEIEKFDQWLKTYSAQPNLQLSELASETEREAYAAAQQIRGSLREMVDQLRASGLDIGDLGPGYWPLMLTKAESDRRLVEELRGVGLARTYRYTPSKEREAFADLLSDPAVRAEVGYDVPGMSGAVFLNAAAINKKLGREAFETDPLVILTRYADYAASTLAARRFSQLALSTGTLLRFPAESEQVYKQLATIAFMKEATERATPAARAKAEALLEKLRTQLKEATSEAELRKVQDAIAATQAEALARLEASRSSVAAARTEAVDADRELAAATQQFEVALRSQTATNMAQYAQSGMENAVAGWQRLRNNASARVSKARARAEEALGDLDATINTPAGPAAAATARERLDKVDTELLSLEDARVQLAEAQAYRQQVLPVFVERQMSAQSAAFTRYEQAVARQVRAVEALESARVARTEAQRALRAAQRNTSVSRAKAVDVLVDSYVRAKMRFDESTRLLAGRKMADLTAQEAAEHRAAAAAFKDAKKLMFDTLGASRRTSTRNAGNEYADMIVDLADKLTDAELVTARVLADADAMDALVKSLEGAAPQTVMGAIGDMVQTYNSIRRFVQPEDLRRLSSVERRVLSLTPPTKLPGGRLAKVEARDLLGQKATVAEAGRAMQAGGVARQIGASEAGGKIVVPRTLEDVWAPNGVADVLESFYRAREFPAEWEKHLAEIYDPIALVWKSATTVGRGPAYVTTNTVGGLANNFYARVSAKAHRLSASIVSETARSLKRIQAENPNKGFMELIPLVEKRLRDKFGSVKVGGENLVDLYVAFLERGGYFTSDVMYQTAELARLGLQVKEPLGRVRGRPLGEQAMAAGGEESSWRRLANWALTNPYQAAMQDAAQLSEMFLRFAAFTDGWDRFRNLDDAFDMMTMLHFDYQDLSGAEIWIKRFIPFYTWARNNVPLQLRAAFVSMDQFSKLVKLNANIRDAFESDDEWLNDYLPDYMVQVGGFVSSFKFGGNNLALFSKLPMTDVDKLFQVTEIAGIPVIAPRPSELVNMTGPAIKTPIELITQRNFQYGREYDSFLESVKAQGSTLVPQFGLIQRVISAAGLPHQQEKQVSNLFQLLIGAPYGVSTYTEKSLRGAAFARNVELSKQVREAAAEAGVDVEWLRKEISSGTPDYLLAAKVSMGLGNVERLKLQNRLQGKDVSRGTTDYNALLRSLEQGR